MKRPLLRLAARTGLLRPAYRAYERLLALRGHDVRLGPDGLPVPPPDLIVKVAGTPDVDWFLEGGRLGFESVRRHVPVEELRSVLDFGCGCGRVTRYWHSLEAEDRPAVSGSDLSPDAIAWCREHLGFGRFEVNELAPPLRFESESFDLVYALSVFTHLTEDLQVAWLGELARVLRPGGRLLVTTHGDCYRERLSNAERERYDAGELVVRWGEVAGTNLAAAYHPPAWLRTRLTGELEHVAYSPEGATGNPHQDVHVFRK